MKKKTAKKKQGRVGVKKTQRNDGRTLPGKEKIANRPSPPSPPLGIIIKIKKSQKKTFFLNTERHRIKISNYFNQQELS